jgi:hypothetical protein
LIRVLGNAGVLYCDDAAKAAILNRASAIRTARFIEIPPCLSLD